ncbi:MAG: hypothetical protein ABW215_06250 [Kibdelosporangium sp.]
MTQPQRDRLADAQAELLRALLAGGPAPAGFDVDRLRVEADALLAKRRRLVAMLEPEACDEIDDFGSLFDEYARSHPRVAGTRAREDAQAFVQWADERTGRDLAMVARPRRWRWGATKKHP